MSNPAPAAPARCPKCDRPRVPAPDCPWCGVLYAKAEAKLAEQADEPSPLEEAPEDAFEDTFEADQERLREEIARHAPRFDYDEPTIEEARQELWLRAAAIPVTLLLSWVLMHSDGLRFVGRIFMGMWVHELGHACTAWLFGHFAFPGPWITLTGESRNAMVIVGLALGLSALGGYGLLRGRRVLVVLAASLLLTQLAATAFASRETARMLIIFFGDGGALVLGTALMLSVYSPRGSKLHQGWLRWGLLVIGAVAFADVLLTWVPARTDFGEIPFGIQSRAGLSDASKLVDIHGWDERALVLRHLRLAWVCGLVMAAAYVRGLLHAKDELRRVSSR